MKEKKKQFLKWVFYKSNYCVQQGMMLNEERQQRKAARTSLVFPPSRGPADQRRLQPLTSPQTRTFLRTRKQTHLLCRKPRGRLHGPLHPRHPPSQRQSDHTHTWTHTRPPSQLKPPPGLLDPPDPLPSWTAITRISPPDPLVCLIPLLLLAASVFLCLYKKNTNEPL